MAFLASQNLVGVHGLLPKIVFGKGHSQNSLSRQAVDFMLNELNLTKFLNNLEGNYGIDEHFIASLQVSEALGLPGGFTDKCLKKDIDIGDVTRLVSIFLFCFWFWRWFIFGGSKQSGPNGA